MLGVKIMDARNRIKWAVDKFGLNRCYSAFSGGKDSRAVLKLARELYPEMLAIHNGHAGEKIGNARGILQVKEPKAENVPLFLNTVDVAVQLDGTRLDEDKEVIFDGTLIHRSDMPNWVTMNGVWGLVVVFPIFDWTERDVLEFLG